MSEMSDLVNAIGGLAKSISDSNEKVLSELKEIKTAMAKNPMDFDPEKLHATTKDIKEVKLAVVEPKDPTKPNLIPPWPDPRTAKPPGYSG